MVLTTDRDNFLIHAGAFGQFSDVAVIHHRSVEETTFELFENEEEVDPAGALSLRAYPNPDMQLLLLDMNGRMVRDYALQG